MIAGQGKESSYYSSCRLTQDRKATTLQIKGNICDRLHFINVHQQSTLVYIYTARNLMKTIHYHFIICDGKCMGVGIIYPTMYESNSLICPSLVFPWPLTTQVARLETITPVFHKERQLSFSKLNNLDFVVYAVIMLTHNNDIHECRQLSAGKLHLVKISFQSHGKHWLHKPKYFNLL